MAAILALAACVSAPAGGRKPDAVRGCWLQREGPQGKIWTTQRWRRDDGVWFANEIMTGPQVEPISPNRATSWELRRVAGGFRLCSFDAMFTPLECYAAFFGRGRAVGAPAAEFEVGDGRLRLWLVTAESRSVYFDGVRCGPD